VALLEKRRPPTTLDALKLLAWTLSNAVNAAGWSISTTTDDFAEVHTIQGVESALDPKSGLRVVEVAQPAAYPLADYPASAQALAHGCAFLAGVDLEGSDPAEVAVLRDLGYNAVLGVGTFDGQHGYLVEIYSDEDHDVLAAIAHHAHVLAHYCVQAVTGQNQLPHAATAGIPRPAAENAEDTRLLPVQRSASPVPEPPHGVVLPGSSWLRERLRRAESVVSLGARALRTRRSPGQEHDRGSARRSNGRCVVVQTALLAVIAAYVVTTVPGVRAAPGVSWWMDGILQNLALWSAVGLCLVRIPPRSPDRRAWQILAVGLASYALAKPFYFWFVQPLDPPPAPSVADALWWGVLSVRLLGVAAAGALSGRADAAGPDARRDRGRLGCSSRGRGVGGAECRGSPRGPLRPNSDQPGLPGLGSAAARLGGRQRRRGTSPPR
jgi:hypothetical protein